MDGLEAEWGDKASVMLLNVQDPAANPLLNELGFRYTPTFILFDGAGNEVWRATGSIDPDAVNQQLNALN